MKFGASLHVARSRVRLAFQIGTGRSVRCGQALAQSGLAVLGSRSCRCCGYPCRERPCGGDEGECRSGQARWTMDTHRYRGGLEEGGRHGLRYEPRGACHDGGQGERKGQHHRLHRDVLAASRRTPVDWWRSCLRPEEGSLPVEGRQRQTHAHEARGTPAPRRSACLPASGREGSSRARRGGLARQAPAFPHVDRPAEFSLPPDNKDAAASRRNRSQPDAPTASTHGRQR